MKSLTSLPHTFLGFVVFFLFPCPPPIHAAFIPFQSSAPLSLSQKKANKADGWIVDWSGEDYKRPNMSIGAEKRAEQLWE